MVLWWLSDSGVCPSIILWFQQNSLAGFHHHPSLRSFILTHLLDNVFVVAWKTAIVWSTHTHTHAVAAIPSGASLCADCCHAYLSEYVSSLSFLIVCRWSACAGRCAASDRRPLNVPTPSALWVSAAFFAKSTPSFSLTGPAGSAGHDVFWTFLLWGEELRCSLT